MAGTPYPVTTKAIVKMLYLDGHRQRDIHSVFGITTPTLSRWANPETENEIRLYNREYGKAYNKTEIGKARARRYRISDKGVASETKYKASDKGRAARIRSDKTRRTGNTNSRLVILLRGRFSKAVEHKCKGGSAVRDLGCSIAELIERFAFFWPDHSWENYGAEWEIDHIRPLASFDLSDPEQVKIACNFANLQPLPVSVNRSKGAKWDGKISQDSLSVAV